MRDGLRYDLAGAAEQDRKAERLAAVYVDDEQDLAVNTRNRYFTKQVPSGAGRCVMAKHDGGAVITARDKGTRAQKNKTVRPDTISQAKLQEIARVLGVNDLNDSDIRTIFVFDRSDEPPRT